MAKAKDVIPACIPEATTCEEETTCPHETKNPIATFGDGDRVWLNLYCTNCDDTFILEGQYFNLDE